MGDDDDAMESGDKQMGGDRTRGDGDSTRRGDGERERGGDDVRTGDSDATRGPGDANAKREAPRTRVSERSGDTTLRELVSLWRFFAARVQGGVGVRGIRRGRDTSGADALVMGNEEEVDILHGFAFFECFRPSTDHLLALIPLSFHLLPSGSVRAKNLSYLLFRGSRSWCDGKEVRGGGIGDEMRGERDGE
jgi:hypothetical protein